MAQQGFLTRFGAGFGIQALMDTILFIRSLLLSPSLKELPRPKRTSTSPVLYKCLRTGAGFSSVCLSFRLLSCAFRWLLGNEDPIHAIAAGVMTSGFAFALLRPPPTIALYLLFKAAESVISDSHRQVVFFLSFFFGNCKSTPNRLLIYFFISVSREHDWKIIRWMDSVYGGGWSLLFAVSTAVLFHAGMLEPQNLKPSYYQFLNKVTGRKLHDINRTILTVYGTNSNALRKDFWPVFDTKHISHHMAKLIEDKETLGKGNELIKELTLKVLAKPS